MSRKSECHTRVSHKSDKQECPTKVSEKNASYKSVPQECFLQECQKSFGCFFRVRVSIRVRGFHLVYFLVI